VCGGYALRLPIVYVLRTKLNTLRSAVSFDGDDVVESVSERAR
jgi:hypothetical protein